MLEFLYQNLYNDLQRPRNHKNTQNLFLSTTKQRSTSQPFQFQKKIISLKNSDELENDTLHAFLFSPILSVELDAFWSAVSKKEPSPIKKLLGRS